MKHPRTTICGILFAIACFVLAYCLSAIVDDFSMAKAPSHTLVLVTKIFLWIAALSGLAGHYHAADHHKLPKM